VKTRLPSRGSWLAPREKDAPRLHLPPPTWSSWGCDITIVSISPTAIPRAAMFDRRGEGSSALRLRPRSKRMVAPSVLRR
jgi:hypothetical protein